MSTTTYSQHIASDAKLECLELKIKNWMKGKERRSSDCVAILWEMCGANSYFADDVIPQMRSFFVNLLSFFCQPGNAEKFNELSGIYSDKEWPKFLSNLSYGFTMLERKYPKAEMHLYEIRHFRSLLEHQVDYIEQEYQND